MTDEAAVRAVIDGIYAAWGRNDADEFVSAYAEDATATLPGSFLDGREAVRATMEALFAGDGKGTKGVAEIRRVRFPREHTAVVNTTSATIPAGAAEPPATGWAFDTWALSERDGHWLVDAYHSSPGA
ncbi:SgcJ/EcaC family oxidoreductase [Amycolatopsis sp. CA-230715]|uniref:SgcJ/EcaC family oxidoreductase n=1 Tax=Amycolatopsis sp. CA-230715 TaxID=2745196 RepID=UPI001C00C81B|nr:SgcJ/EcaC family oxidoreductase [Amycolatopsis sp. CA-230715]QWF78511.1 hypothetical protein HUW46_01907 [Amycolatopsis sp. CA-230715]